MLFCFLFALVLVVWCGWFLVLFLWGVALIGLVGFLLSVVLLVVGCFGILFVDCYNVHFLILYCLFRLFGVCWFGGWWVL